MIMANMRNYDYYLYNNEPDAYGQSTLIKDADGNPLVQGTINLSIHITSQNVQDNILYKGATYLGLTLDKDVSDKYVIQYGQERLKVLYVNPQGHLKQVFMGNM